MRLFTDEIYVVRCKSLETVGKGSLYEGLPALWVVLACIQREFPINAGEKFFSGGRISLEVVLPWAGSKRLLKKCWFP